MVRVTAGRYNLGKSLEDLGRREEARTAFEKVLTLDPGHPSAQLNLGNYHFYRGAGEEALAHHRKVLNSSRATGRDMRSALANMGQVYRMRNMHEEAREVFTRGLEMDPSDGLAWANVMVARRTLCEWEGLEELQSRALAMAIEELR
jgi:protein O-GlcNAc transferase